MQDSDMRGREAASPGERAQQLLPAPAFPPGMCLA